MTVRVLQAPEAPPRPSVVDAVIVIFVPGVAVPSICIGTAAEVSRPPGTLMVLTQPLIGLVEGLASRLMVFPPIGAATLSDTVTVKFCPGVTDAGLRTGAFGMSRTGGAAAGPVRPAMLDWVTSSFDMRSSTKAFV